MADGSLIQWTDATWPIVQGCDPVSAGCAFCYVPKELWRMMHHPNAAISGPLQGTVDRRDGTTRFTGKVALRRDRLHWPFCWKKPRKIFVPSHGDLFHAEVPDSFLDLVFDQMEACDWHTFQVLTKRAARMRAYIARRWAGRAAPAHIWLMVSAEDQETANARIPDLLRTKAAVRCVSREPGLAPVDLTYLIHDAGERVVDATTGCHGFRDGDGWESSGCGPKLDLVIDGGESGSDRPFDLDASRELERQCVDNGVAYFRKQLGARPFEREPSAWPKGFPHGDGSTRLMPDGFGRYLVQGLKHPKGGDPAEWPADLRRRELPQVRA